MSVRVQIVLSYDDDAAASGLLTSRQYTDNTPVCINNNNIDLYSA